MVNRLLFVEDDKAQLALFKDALKDWNGGNLEKQFELHTAETYDEALVALQKTRFDGALLDLRLPGGGELPGQKLANLCVSEYGLPAAIISGNPADYDKSNTNGMLEVFNKGDGDAYDRSIRWFGDLCHMMKILGAARSHIRREGASVFSKQVWPRWKAYENLTGINEQQLIGIVSRQYASHIADSLGIENGASAKWHPYENYTLPALHEARPHTGDIFRFEDGIWIVLTPQCDMATGKATSVLLASCEPSPAINEWKENVSSLADGSNTKKKAADRFFGRLVNQSEPAFHFLPPLEGGQPLMVNFKSLMTITLLDLQNKLSSRIASVASPFLPNLTQRFGGYISRMGQPDIDVGHFT